MSAHTLRIALLHLAPIPGDITKNRRLVEKAVNAAARLGATWIITPELIVTGYTFADNIGTKWILPQPDPWMTHMSRLAARLRVTLFLSCPEQDRKSHKLYNSLFAIAANGTIVGSHRKIQYAASGIGGLVDARYAGSRRSSSAIHTGRDADLCRCVYVRHRTKSTGPRSTTAGLIGRMGPRPAWPEWGMGTMHPRHSVFRSWCAIGQDQTRRSTFVKPRVSWQRTGSVCCPCLQHVQRYSLSSGM